VKKHRKSKHNEWNNTEITRIQIGCGPGNITNISHGTVFLYCRVGLSSQMNYVHTGKVDTGQ